MRFSPQTLTLPRDIKSTRLYSFAIIHSLWMRVCHSQIICILFSFFVAIYRFLYANPSSSVYIFYFLIILKKKKFFIFNRYSSRVWSCFSLNYLPRFLQLMYLSFAFKYLKYSITDSTIIFLCFSTPSRI